MTRAEARALAEEFCARIAWLGPAEIKPMFGAAAIMVEDAMVAFVSAGTIFLRVDEETRDELVARGATAFAYTRAGRLTPMKSYYAAPDDVLDDDATLRRVLEAGYRDALAAKAKRRPRRRAAR
jgi:DNA transformation protein